MSELNRTGNMASHMLSRRSFLCALAAAGVARIVPFAAPAVVLSGCVSQGGWRSLPGKGLPQLDTSYFDLLYASRREMYLCGEYSNYTKNSFFPLLYHSADGGDSWQSIALPGTMVEARRLFAHGRMLTLLMQRDRKTYEIALLQSPDAGATWEEIPLPAPCLHVRSGSMLVYPGGNILLFAETRIKPIQSSLWEYDGKEKRWQRRYHAHAQQAAWLASCSMLLADDTFVSKLRLHSQETGDWQDIPLSALFFPQYASKTHDTWYIGGRGPRPATILALRNGKVHNLLPDAFGNYTLHGVQAFGSTLCCNVSPPRSGSILGVSQQLLLSRDAGATWRIVDYPFSLISEPGALYAEEKYTVYQGMGRLREYRFA